jgi:hypothetical protein
MMSGSRRLELKFQAESPSRLEADFCYQPANSFAGFSGDIAGRGCARLVRCRALQRVFPGVRRAHFKPSTGVIGAILRLSRPGGALDEVVRLSCPN